MTRVFFTQWKYVFKNEVEVGLVRHAKESIQLLQTCTTEMLKGLFQTEGKWYPVESGVYTNEWGNYYLV